MRSGQSTSQKVAIVAVVAVLLVVVILLKQGQQAQPGDLQVSAGTSQHTAEAEPTALADSEAPPSSPEVATPQPLESSEEPTIAASRPAKGEAEPEQPASDAAAGKQTPPEPSGMAERLDTPASKPETEEARDGQAAAAAPAISRQPRALPRLVDLGAGECIPCKMMAPILEGLEQEYAGKLEVDFVDVWERPAAGEEYGIRMIPTQIFYDTEGKEFYRHEGFFAKEDILCVFRDHGIEL